MTRRSGIGIRRRAQACRERTPTATTTAATVMYRAFGPSGGPSFLAKWRLLSRPTVEDARGIGSSAGCGCGWEPWCGRVATVASRVSIRPRTSTCAQTGGVVPGRALLPLLQERETRIRLPKTRVSTLQGEELLQLFARDGGPSIEGGKTGKTSCETYQGLECG